MVVVDDQSVQQLLCFSLRCVVTPQIEDVSSLGNVMWELNLDLLF